MTRWSLFLQTLSLLHHFLGLYWDEGYDDGEILEINQIVSYFAYANRVVLGLGVSTAGDILGLSPSAASDDWSHR